MNENQIEVPRGTLYPVRIDLVDPDGNLYTLADGERLVLGVTDSYQGDGVLFTREASRDPDGVYVVDIEPEDTAELAPGRYFYDVNLYLGDGRPMNVIELSAMDIIQSTASIEVNAT